MQKHLLLLFAEYSYINNLTQVNVTIYTSKESRKAVNHKQEYPRYKKIQQEMQAGVSIQKVCFPPISLLLSFKSRSLVGAMLQLRSEE